MEVGDVIFFFFFKSCDFILCSPLFDPHRNHTTIKYMGPIKKK